MGDRGEFFSKTWDFPSMILTGRSISMEPVVLRDYSWFCTQGSFLIVLGGSYEVPGIEWSQLEASTLPTTVFLQIILRVNFLTTLLELTGHAVVLEQGSWLDFTVQLGGERCIDCYWPLGLISSEQFPAGESVFIEGKGPISIWS